METKLLWSIGSQDGRSEDLFDNFKDPNRLGNVIWDADKGQSSSGGTQWPMFHPSESDPDGGYQLHPYTIQFSVNEQPADSYELEIHYLVIAPRMSYLEVIVNGVSGFAHFRPTPSQSGEIILMSGLHTSIYSDGVVNLKLPGKLLRSGRNTLELIARDGGQTIVVDRIEAIKRLDRMANGAGILYKQLALKELSTSHLEQRFHAEVESTVLYRKGMDGKLVNDCRLYLDMPDETSENELVLSLSDAANSTVQKLQITSASFGHAMVSFEVFDGEGPVSYTLEANVNGLPATFTGSFNRCRKWNVYITPHAHTDIGYTHRQWEVAERLNRNIDTALDWIEQEEKNLKPGERADFTYHLDSGWAVENFLATRDERRKSQLLKAIRDGKVSIAGNYVDLLTQTSGLEDLIRNHEFLGDLLRPEGMKPAFNAIVDVASVTSSLPALLEGSGIRYLVHANNQDRGPFRLNGGLHKLSPFYWEGQQGGRVLCWLAKMYCELRKVCGSPPLASAAERGLDLWLHEFERESYAPDAVLLYGQEADNTDMDPQPNEFVKDWNARYAYPKLIASDVIDFFEYVENNFGSQLQSVRGDGGAYWEDGVGSSIIPTIEARNVQAMLPAAERLEALAVLQNEGWTYPIGQFDSAWRDLLLYDEHTWGAFLSATEPEALLQQDQWEVKRHMAASALQWGKRLLHSAATRHSLSWNNNGREIVVYNPHSWTISGPVRVEISPGEIALDADTGNPISLRRVNRLSSQEIVELWIDQLAGLSYKRILLKEDVSASAANRTGSMESIAGGDLFTMESEWYRIAIDTQRGFVTDWFDKEEGKQLADASSPWGFGQLLYAEGGEGTRLISNQADLPDGNPNVLADFILRDAKISSYPHGQSLRLTGMAPYGELDIEWTLFNKEKKIAVQFIYRKEERPNKEAVYVAFPFALPDAEVLSDSQLGWVNWDRDQLPGGCKEWLPLQTGILVKHPQASAFLASPDIPLFCVNDIVRGRWPKELKLSGGTVFSYVLNNYWHTNYKGTQGGEIQFRYVLTSGSKQTPEQAYRMGWEARQPLYAQRMSFQDFRQTAIPYQQSSGGQLAQLDSDQAVVTTIKKARFGEGFIVRLQEIAGTESHAAFRIKEKRIAKAWLTDLLENEVKELAPEADGDLRIPLKPWGLQTVRFLMEN